MAKMNTRKYVCLDCKEFQMVHPTERGRRSRLRCRWCGSYWLEPYSAGAGEQRMDELGAIHQVPQEGSASKAVDGPAKTARGTIRRARG